MKILFFDLEFASSKNGCKICEFGYVITNENLEIIEKNNLIINPNLANNEWDWRVLRKILTRSKQEYEERLTFKYYYPKIKEIIYGCDYILGHSLFNDVKALNDDCLRNGKESLNFDFYDVKLFYQEYANTKREISVNNILKELNIEGQAGEHDAEVDAYNTMLEFKEIINKLGVSFTEMLELCPSAKDRTENFKILSLQEKNNNIEKNNKKTKNFLKLLKNLAQNYPERENWQAICFSDTIFEEDIESQLKLIKAVFDSGYNYTQKVSLCSYFVVGEKEGKRDKSCNYNIEKNHIQIHKITLSELFKMLNVKISDNGEIVKINDNVNENSQLYLKLKESLDKKSISYEEFIKSLDENK